MFVHKAFWQKMSARINTEEEEFEEEEVVYEEEEVPEKENVEKEKEQPKKKEEIEVTLPISNTKKRVFRILLSLGMLGIVIYFASLIYGNLNQKKYSDVCEFYSSKYNEYKNVLKERQRKYNESFTTIDKTKELIERADKEINNLTPARQELDKLVEEKRKLQGEKTREKNSWRAKKQQEEKTIGQLDIQKKEKQAILDNTLAPFENGITKTTIALNKLQPQDITEMKNTWDNLVFGKYLLQKIFEILGDSNAEWDNIKKSLDVKIIKNLIALSPVKNKEKYINITKEITSNPDFSSGENKFQKPYKVCGYLCDYFNACQKYFNEIENQRRKIKVLYQ